MPRSPAKRPRGASVTQTIRALRILARPTSCVDLAEQLGVSVATAKRIVAGFREAGLDVRTVRDGRAVTHAVRT